MEDSTTGAQLSEESSGRSNRMEWRWDTKEAGRWSICVTVKLPRREVTEGKAGDTGTA